MDEVLEMGARALPWNWGAAKWATAGLLALILLAWYRVRRGKVKLHATIMLATLLFLISISVHGVATRGVMGTVATEEHGWFYVSVAWTHLLSGGIYFLLGLFVAASGLLRKQRRSWFRRHKVMGRFAASCAIVSITCLFFLK